MNLHVFTVIGFYPDSLDRFADIVEAIDADDAEEKCRTNYPGVVICGVIAGSHICVEQAEKVTLD